MNQIWRGVKSAALWIDRAIEIFALGSLAAMALIVTLQVVTRKLFNFVFFWSEEVTLLLLVWFAILGIGIGFREKLHISMESFTRLFPASWNKALDKIISISIFLFGLYFIVYGWDFTVKMFHNTLAATGWPLSLRYVVMPITGVLICFYSTLEFLGMNTVRHHDTEEGGTGS